MAKKTAKPKKPSTAKRKRTPKPKPPVVRLLWHEYEWEAGARVIADAVPDGWKKVADSDVPGEILIEKM